MNIQIVYLFFVLGLVAEVSARTDKEVQKMISVLGYTPEDAKRVQAKREKIKIAFSNLPASHKFEFHQKMQRAIQMLRQNEVVKAHYNFTLAHTIFDRSITLMNNLGSVYLELRFLKKANQTYLRVCELNPVNPIYRFNLGESYYTQKQYSKAQEQFEILHNLLDGDMNHKLVQLGLFRRQLCLLGMITKKESQEQNASSLTKQFMILNQKSSKLKTSLLFHYSSVLDAYRKGDINGAVRLRQDAEYIFPNKADHAAYVDGLSEFGYFLGN